MARRSGAAVHAVPRGDDPGPAAALAPLWLLPTGWTVRAAAVMLGMHERSVQQWLVWYRTGGVESVAAHRTAGKRTRLRLTEAQRVALLAKAAMGRFRTTAEAAAWVKEAIGAAYTVAGMHQLAPAAVHAEGAPASRRDRRPPGAGRLEREGCAEALTAAGAWKAEGIATLVWDGAPSHRAKAVREAGPILVTSPPAAPELNPPKRVFQELRRAVEGLVYATLAEQGAASA